MPRSPVCYGLARPPRRSALRRLSGRLVLAALCVGAGACMETVRLQPASLAGSRERVTVTFPTPQPLRARAAAGDSALGLVSQLVGWPAAVRGDTVDVQVDQWWSGSGRFEMAATDYVVSIPPGSGAVIHAERGDDGRSIGVLVALAALVVVVLIALADAFEEY